MNDRLKEIEERLVKIKNFGGEGSWKIEHDPNAGTYIILGANGSCLMEFSFIKELVEFVVSAREDIPWLIEKVKQFKRGEDYFREQNEMSNKRADKAFDFGAEQMRERVANGLLNCPMLFGDAKKMLADAIRALPLREEK